MLLYNMTASIPSCDFKPKSCSVSYYTSAATNCSIAAIANLLARNNKTKRASFALSRRSLKSF